MKTLILSDYHVVSEYIKDALSELQPFSMDKYSWFKGKFYTKELYLVDNCNKNDLSTLLEFLLADGPIKNVISIGLGQPLTLHLKQGDLLINDYPNGSCQLLVDRFLNYTPDDEEELPLRIFAGTILGETSENQELSGLACLDPQCGEMFATIKNKGLSTLAIRLIGGEDNQHSLDQDVINSVMPKLLLLLKKTVEQVS